MLFLLRIARKLRSRLEYYWLPSLALSLNLRYHIGDRGVLAWCSELLQSENFLLPLALYAALEEGLLVQKKVALCTSGGVARIVVRGQDL